MHHSSEDVKVIFRKVPGIATIAEEFVEELEIALGSNLDGNDIVVNCSFEKCVLAIIDMKPTSFIKL